MKFFKISIEKFNYLWGHYHMGCIFINSNNPQEKLEGLNYLKQAHSLNDDSNQNHLEISKKYGEELIKDDDDDIIDSGIEVLEGLLKLFPENVEIFYLIAKAFEKKEDMRKAINRLEIAHKIVDFYTNPDYLFYLGSLYEKNGSIKEAVDIFKSTLLRNKEHIPTLTNLGRILLNKKEDERAMKYFNFALTLEDNNILANFGNGKIFQDKQEYKKALDHYYKVIKIDPNHFK